jgi:hypothetical protein
MSDPLTTWLKQRGLTLDGDPPTVQGLGLRLVLTPVLRNEWAHRVLEDPEGLEAELAAMVHAPGLPSGWLVARGGLRLLLMARERVLDDALHLPLSPKAAAALVHSDPDERLLTFVRAGHLDGWLTGLEEAHEAALAGLDAVLERTALEVADAGGRTVGVLQTDSPFKASLLLAPGLKAKVGPALGWPLLAVAPCRDFLTLFADDALIPDLASAVMHEREASAHPISDEVFRVGDGGLEAIGAYGAADQ